MPRDNQLSHSIAGIVPSAPGSLTAVFGMGTGVSFRGMITRQNIKKTSILVDEEEIE